LDLTRPNRGTSAAGAFFPFFAATGAGAAAAAASLEATKSAILIKTISCKDLLWWAFWWSGMVFFG
jgi:hypothetical protein